MDDDVYLNTINLLKKALEFYANESNYENNIPLNGELCSYVELDNGEQARFALKKINEEIIDYYDKIEKNIADFENIQTSGSTESIYNTIKNMFKVDNNDSKI